MEDINYRISDTKRTLMRGVAGSFEALEAIIALIGVGVFINPLVIRPMKYFSFWFWFNISGVYVFKFNSDKAKKTIWKKLWQFAFETAPIFGAFPIFFFMVNDYIKESREEDEEKAKKSNQSNIRRLNREKLRLLAKEKAA